MTNSIKLPYCNESIYSANDLSMIGIVCKESGFLLAGRMNRTIKSDFEKTEDFILWHTNEKTDNLDCYYWKSGKNGCHYLLLKSCNSLPVFIKQWEQYDYVLVLLGQNNTAVAQDLLGALNAFDIVSYVQILHDGTLELEKPSVENNVVQLNLLDMEFEQKLPKSKTKSKKNASKISTTALNSFLFDLESQMCNISKEKPQLNRFYVEEVLLCKNLEELEKQYRLDKNCSKSPFSSK
ncbi:MAG: hypothetical protein U0K83_07375 [Bacteroidales bacterium]|nr:hypothetical protein [Bacteroidales bacterium]